MKKVASFKVLAFSIYILRNLENFPNTLVFLTYTPKKNLKILRFEKFGKLGLQNF